MGRHAAIETVEDGRRECRVCGTRVAGGGASLRHEGELLRPTPPARRRHAPAFTLALERVHSVLTHLPQEADDRDRARAVVEALYLTGMLRRTTGNHRQTV